MLFWPFVGYTGESVERTFFCLGLNSWCGREDCRLAIVSEDMKLASLTGSYISLFCLHGVHTLRQ
jgi:hypothetical protein